MRYKVRVSKKAIKGLDSAPVRIQEAFKYLAEDLACLGPALPNWKNYSKLSATRHHCRLSHKWVACWSFESGTIEIEVYYAGSRENAPY